MRRSVPARRRAPLRRERRAPSTGDQLAYRVEPLGPQHDRLVFSSCVEPLDRYLHVQAGQDSRKRVTSCFVAVAGDDRAVAGYHTLSATNVALSDLPPDLSGFPAIRWYRPP